MRGGDDPAIIEPWKQLAAAEPDDQMPRSRFPAGVPTDIVTRIADAMDDAVLARWLDDALTTSSLDDFRNCLRS